MNLKNRFIQLDLSHQNAKNYYKEKRRQFAGKVSYPVVIVGPESIQKALPYFESTESFLVQEPALLLLTGVNQTDTALMMMPDGSDILFLPKKDSKKEMWTGYHLGIGTPELKELAKNQTGFEHIEAYQDLMSVVLEKANAFSKIGLLWHQSKKNKNKVKKDHLYQFKKKVQRRLKTKGEVNVDIINISDQYWDLVIPIDQVQLNAFRKAKLLTGNAFQKTLDNFSNLNSETAVAGFLDGEISKQSYYRNSFPTIAATGENAKTLHYTKNTDPLKKGQLLLLDFGLRWHFATTDITRTIPVSGEMDPMQTMLYNIVLETQKAVEQKVCPGITIEALDAFCWEHLEMLLKERFLNLGGQMKRDYKRAPHKVSHLIGIEVHWGDPFGEYRSNPLQPGWIISNEPGLYGHFSISLNGKKYEETLGIRIEDDLLVTKDGCENLTKSIAKV